MAVYDHRGAGVRRWRREAVYYRVMNIECYVRITGN